MEELEVPAEADAIAEALALRSRFDAALASAVAEFRSGKRFVDDGATSTVAWLRDRGRLTKRAATRTVTVASRVVGLPVTWAAWRDGTLSDGQVEAIVANISNATVERYLDHEAELVAWLAPLSVAGVARAMRVWKVHAEAELNAPAGDEPAQHLQLSTGLDGRWVLEGELGSEVGQVLSTALRLAERPNEEGETRKASERRAEALGELCRFFLDHQTDHPGGRHRPHLSTSSSMRATWPPAVPAASPTAPRSMPPPWPAWPPTPGCTGWSWREPHHPPLRHRHPHHPRLFVERPGAARRRMPIPGVRRPLSWSDGHHVRWVERGGPTSLANLVLVCRSHYTRLHTADWRAHLDDDGTFTVTDPRGRVRTTSPPRTRLIC